MRVTKEMLKTKGKYFKSGPKYAVVSTQMDLLGITDVSTPRQEKNGTIVWRLPIKNNWKNGSFIEVASFATGYVRNQNSGYSNYQLNKRCESDPQYYPVHEWCDDANDYVKTDKFRQYTTRSCKLIPIEIERLEYLISYCLKNYYIKRANEVADGKLISKWTHEYEMNSLQNKLANSVPKWKYDEANETYSENTGAMARINGMEEKLDAMTEDRDLHVNTIIKLEEKLYDLQNKLATINRISE